MSSKEHRQQFFVQTMIGLVLNAAGIATIYYACFTRSEDADWKFWALITIAMVSIGLLLIGNGIVHKVKADFIRRQKGRYEKKSEQGIV